MRRLLSPVAAIGLVVAIGAHAAVATDLLGDVVPASTATRTIALAPATQHVNVTEGDVVRFTANGQEFSFKFDGAPTVDAFDLQRVAPAGMLDHTVIAYVAPSSDFLGGRSGRGR